MHWPRSRRPGTRCGGGAAYTTTSAGSALSGGTAAEPTHGGAERRCHYGEPLVDVDPADIAAPRAARIRRGRAPTRRLRVLEAAGKAANGLHGDQSGHAFVRT